MIKERHRHSLGKTVHLMPDDILACTVQDRETMTGDTFCERINREVEVDTIVTFDVKNQLGLTGGIGAVFGKAKQ